MSVRDIRSHLAQIYGVEVGPDLISKVTDAVIDELVAWPNQSLDAVRPIIYIDAPWVKIRSGSVVSKLVYLAVRRRRRYGRPRGRAGAVGRSRG
ncbi:transposase [Streptomyces sp. NPDC059851]|uniref:transposase n=1 Tax=Streptomyces sp. NPDC059851 TaxID=3346971 RepID=UPI00365EF3FC